MKSQISLKLYGSLKNNDSLSSNISGNYKFDLNKFELKPINAAKIMGEKSIYSIRIGLSQKHFIIISHRDYFVIKTHYIKINNKYFFKYNEQVYSLELDRNNFLYEINVQIEPNINVKYIEQLLEL